MYKKIKIGTGQIDPERIVKTVDGINYYIPFDPSNSDYQEYLEWAKTNTAEEAD